MQGKCVGIRSEYSKSFHTPVSVHIVSVWCGVWCGVQTILNPNISVESVSLGLKFMSGSSTKNGTLSPFQILQIHRFSDLLI